MIRGDDQDLVARCLAGSDEAFADLVDVYKNLVFGVISQVVANKSRVEDLSQDVFVKVHKGLPSFRGEAKLSTWICRIVLNVCTDAATRERPSASLDERDEDGPLGTSPPCGIGRSRRSNCATSSSTRSPSYRSITGFSFRRTTSADSSTGSLLIFCGY